MTEREDSYIAGTVEGGKRAAAKNLAKDPDFYKNIGRIGGSVKTEKGFALNRELARRAGTIGGRISRRGKALKNQEEV